MLRPWPWIAAAIVAASLTAGLVTGIEAAVFFILPELTASGSDAASTAGTGPALTVFVALVSVPCWSAGLTLLGLPLGLALRRIGRVGYVTAMAAGAIGGAVALGLGLAVFGLQAPGLLATYAAMMVLPGAVAGFIVRKLAYDGPARA